MPPPRRGVQWLHAAPRDRGGRRDGRGSAILDHVDRDRAAEAEWERMTTDRPSRSSSRVDGPTRAGDNTDFEQKNWTYVHKLLAYFRCDSPVAPAAIVARYRHVLRSFHAQIVSTPERHMNIDQVSTPSSPPQNSGYMPYLDGLRALAVFGVLISHFTNNQHWLIVNAQWGRLGVDLFFVLSGFLITQILLRYRGDSRNFKDAITHLRIFYSRRALRIFPIYYLTILVATLLGYEPIRTFLFWHLTYTLNIAIAVYPKLQFGASHHFWSLAIEEQFYLIWPWVVLLVPPKRLRYVMFGFILIGVVSRMSPIFVPGFNMDPLANTRFDVLGLGALLALYWHEPLVFAKEKLVLLITGVTGGLPLVILVMRNAFSLALVPMANVLVEFGAALFFMAVIDRAAQPHPWRIFASLGWRPLRYIGKISYGIYVYHPFVELMILYILGAFNIPVPTSFGPVQLLLYGSGSILFASVSWYLIERPINKLKERITATRGQSLVPL